MISERISLANDLFMRPRRRYFALRFIGGRQMVQYPGYDYRSGQISSGCQKVGQRGGLQLGGDQLRRATDSSRPKTPPGRPGWLHRWHDIFAAKPHPKGPPQGPFSMGPQYHLRGLELPFRPTFYHQKPSPPTHQPLRPGQGLPPGAG